MKNKLYLLLIVPIFAFTLHDYHLSLTKIIKGKNNTLEITMRYYIDDVETTINKLENIKSELNTKREFKNIDSLLQIYVLENFRLTLNKQQKKLTFIGKEYEKDVVHFYLETDTVSEIKSIEIQNKMLLNTFDDQQNLVKLNLNNQKKTFYLKNGNDKEMLKFN